MDKTSNREPKPNKNSSWSRFLKTFAFVVISIIIAILCIVFIWKVMTKLPPPENDRIECPGIDDVNCTNVNCSYQPVEYGPSCYMEKDKFGFKVDNVKERKDGIEIKLSSLTPRTPYGETIKNVLFNLTYLTRNIVRFQFKDINNKRYEVPVQNDFPLLQDLQTADKENIAYEVDYTRTDVFHFWVKRTKGATLWNTTIGALLLSDKFLQIASYLPSSNIYGLGEHVHDTLRHKMDFISWPMFARDRFPSSKANQHNLYGVHPFYTCLEEDGKSHGVLFLNSNAMDVTLMPAPAISFRTTGGILDFFIFIGDNPEHVIQLYTSLIGRSMIPPYWSLGFQLSRYGYNSLAYLAQAINRTRTAKIPHAVQYLDIDHMSENMDFTYDNKSFPNLPQYMDEQREMYGLKWIIILDPTIAAIPGYKTWTSGLEKGVFISKAKHWPESMFPSYLKDYNITFGKVWPPTYAAFPDFFLEKTKQWWKENIVEFRNSSGIKFDALWIDMNEPANFETNENEPSFCKDSSFRMSNRSECRALVCPENEYEDPPYNPLQKITGDRLSTKTLCMESMHILSGKTYRHYDVHSLYGWSQSQPTLDAAQEATGTRSLVISRSTYPSSGRYAGHWLGDNTSNFAHMKNSIIGMIEFNLFGIPYVGADVCGFAGDADANLCKRWMQLGAFYPFYRNHNAIDQSPQDPAIFGSDVAVASRKAVQRRIALNPYLYTLFYRAHVDGSTVVRPVFHEFPNDETTWDLDRQFMWGKSLLISPILNRNQSNVNLYLPRGEWWYFNYGKTRMEEHSGQYVTVTDADEYTPMMVRGGTILPLAVFEWENYPEKDNASTRKMDLFVFPEKGVAKGELFMDDGISKDTIQNEAYALYNFKLNQNCTLKIESDEKANFKRPKPVLNKIFIFKVKSATKNSGNYVFKMNKKWHVFTITIGDEMNKLKELTWEDENGECSMLN